MSFPDPLDQRIQDYLDGRLAGDERARLERELADNADARERLEALRWLSTAAGEALETEMPADLTAKIRGALDRADAGAPWRGWLATAAGARGRGARAFRHRQTGPAGPTSAALPQIVATDVHDYVRGAAAADARDHGCRRDGALLHGAGDPVRDAMCSTCR